LEKVVGVCETTDRNQDIRVCVHSFIIEDQTSDQQKGKAANRRVDDILKEVALMGANRILVNECIAWVAAECLGE